jgi:tRNA G18 (ribose-2'-O)-methylase SpoU
MSNDCLASVLLYAPQDFHNLCLLARTLEAFGYRECHVFDPERLVRERYGKSRSRELRVVSAGAFEKISWVRIDDPLRFIAGHTGRAVASVAEPGARALSAHRFSPTDLLVFGSESRGLPNEVVAACSAAVTIPTHGRTQSLNLVVALGIVLFEVQRQSTATLADARRGPASFRV